MHTFASQTFVVGPWWEPIHLRSTEQRSQADFVLNPSGITEIFTEKKVGALLCGLGVLRIQNVQGSSQPQLYRPPKNVRGCGSCTNPDVSGEGAEVKVFVK